MCKHEVFTKDCATCEEIYQYISAAQEQFGAFEGYDPLNVKDWADMVEYFNKWSDYEGENEAEEAYNDHKREVIEDVLDEMKRGDEDL